MDCNPCLYIRGETLDDLLYECFQLLLKRPFSNIARRSGSSGKFSELIGVTLELKNPRARLSKSDAKGKPFSPLGEFLWYLSGKDELAFIEYYISRYRDESYNGKQVYGAYGPRLFRSNERYDQVHNIINLLKENAGSRRAVIQLFESRDIDPGLCEENKLSIPCTCCLQFLLRDNKLHMVSTMRSNDAFWGLPHDVYAFTMVQEYIASALNCQLGTYMHFVGSLHMYEATKPRAEAYIEEGIHPTTEHMNSMPSGDQKIAIDRLLALEMKIREGKAYEIDKCELDLYWKELAYLLAFFKAWKEKDTDRMRKIKGNIMSKIYYPFLEKRIHS